MSKNIGITWIDFVLANNWVSLKSKKGWSATGVWSTDLLITQFELHFDLVAVKEKINSGMVLKREMKIDWYLKLFFV